MPQNTDLKTYSFTEEDINLITYALRRLVNETGLGTIKEDSQNLVEHIERMKKEKA